MVFLSWCAQGFFEPSESLWQASGLSLSMILPFLPSCWGFSFAFGHGVSLFGGIQHSPVDGGSAASCSFRVHAGEDEHVSFYSAILCHKKIRDTKGTFHAKMGTTKDRNSMDLTEAEDFKKRWSRSS